MKWQHSRRQGTMDVNSPAAAATDSLDPTPQQCEETADLFRVLSDPSRLRCLLLLAKGECNVAGVCDATGLPQPMASHHLGLLRHAGLVKARRSGKRVFYSLGGKAQADGDDALRFDTGGEPPCHVRVRCSRAPGA